MSLTDNTQSFSEDQTLQKFGYQQEYKRELKRFASFAVGFSFISITTGIFTTYGSVLISSGPLGIWTSPLAIIGHVESRYVVPPTLSESLRKTYRLRRMYTKVYA